MDETSWYANSLVDEILLRVYDCDSASLRVTDIEVFSGYSG